MFPQVCLKRSISRQLVDLQACPSLLQLVQRSARSTLLNSAPLLYRRISPAGSARCEQLVHQARNVCHSRRSPSATSRPACTLPLTIFCGGIFTSPGVIIFSMTCRLL